MKTVKKYNMVELKIRNGVDSVTSEQIIDLTEKRDTEKWKMELKIKHFFIFSFFTFYPERTDRLYFVVWWYRALFALR